MSDPELVGDILANIMTAIDRIGVAFAEFKALTISSSAMMELTGLMASQ